MPNVFVAISVVNNECFKYCKRWKFIHFMNSNFLNVNSTVSKSKGVMTKIAWKQGEVTDNSDRKYTGNEHGTDYRQGKGCAVKR